MRTLYESLLDIDDVESNLNLELITMIDNWCKDNIEGKYTINKKTLTINSPSSIKITNKELTEFPSYIHFGIVQGNSYCNKCTSLTSLEGAPKEVGTNFFCSNCTSLTSLEGAPEKISNDFYCNGCSSLKSLKGAPKEVGGDFYCSYCDSPKSLEGAPEKVGGCFHCNSCTSLKSLEGAPKEVGKDFYCGSCTSFCCSLFVGFLNKCWYAV